MINVFYRDIDCARLGLGFRSGPRHTVLADVSIWTDPHALFIRGVESVLDKRQVPVLLLFDEPKSLQLRRNLVLDLLQDAMQFVRLSFASLELLLLLLFLLGHHFAVSFHKLLLFAKLLELGTKFVELFPAQVTRSDCVRS